MTDTFAQQELRSAAALVVKAAFAGSDAYGAARAAARADKELTFGELDVADFCGVVCRFAPAGGAGGGGPRELWDLGSGAGRCVLGLSLCGGFDVVGGVEIQRPLHDLGAAAVARVGAWRAGDAPPPPPPPPKAAARAPALTLEAMLDACAGEAEDGAALGLEAVAAALVAAHGHRAYKAALRGAGAASLSKFVARHRGARVGRFAVADDGTAAADAAAAPVAAVAAALAAAPSPAAAPASDGALERALARLAGRGGAAELVCGDVFETDRWHGAAVVFCNVLLFGPATLARLCAALAALRPGAVVLSTAKLDAAHLEKRHDAWCRASWSGGAQLHIYRRRAS